jgi:hypothetical protein
VSADCASNRFTPLRYCGAGSPLQDVRQQSDGCGVHPNWRVQASAGEVREEGWEALPLTAQEMSRLFPSVWATPKAAERWFVKNPPEAHRDIIRVWGVLNTYRPPGQTSWSKALVRHGADAREALAGVLGVRAGDIRVRNGAGSEVLATANTGSTRHPQYAQYGVGDGRIRPLRTF